MDRKFRVAVVNNWSEGGPLQLTAEGGVAPYTFKVVGRLPEGLRLEANGELHGRMHDREDTALVRLDVTDSEPWTQATQYLGIWGAFDDGTPCAMVLVDVEPPDLVIEARVGEPLEINLNEIFTKHGKEEAD